MYLGQIGLNNYEKKSLCMQENKQMFFTLKALHLGRTSPMYYKEGGSGDTALVAVISGC